MADDGPHAQALRLSEHAAWLYLRHGDRPGMGTALVDQSMWLYYLDRPTAAIADLLRGGLEGLSLLLVRRVRAQIEAAKQEPEALKSPGIHPLESRTLRPRRGPP